MSKTKTTYTGENVIDFINSYVENDLKKADSFQLLELIKNWSRYEPKMWGRPLLGSVITTTNMLVDTKELLLF